MSRGGATRRGAAASECPFTVCRSLHPDHLWIWRPNVYVDENERTWLPIIIEVRPLGRRPGWAWGCQHPPSRRPPPGPGCQGPPPGGSRPREPRVQVPRGWRWDWEAALPGARGLPGETSGSCALPAGRGVGLGVLARGPGPRVSEVCGCDLEGKRNALGFSVLTWEGE